MTEENEHAPKQYRLSRDHERDIEFNGRLLGHGEYAYERQGEECRVLVDIYATQSGKYIIHTHRSYEDSDTVLVAENAQDVLTKMKFAPAGLEAWHAACDSDEKLRAYETVVVE